jgi:hypothetical protein
MLEIRETTAEPVVGALDVLRDVADGLLGGCRAVVVFRRRNGVERCDQMTAIVVGEALEGEHDAVRPGPGRGRLAGKHRGTKESEKSQRLSVHIGA